jgi:mannosyltransferase
MKHNHWALMTILLAFALRVYALDAQSLWNDEGTSVALALLSIEAIINGAARDIHPPLYYLLLHFWMPLAGNTEYAVRFLSVIAGVVIVALVFRIAYFVFDEHVALLAALLTALSPFQVYYSQEARMYVWVMLFAAISVYAMMCWLNLKTQISNLKPVFGIWDLGFGTWLIYIAATIAMLYTQYVGAFIVLAENLAFGVWLFFAIRNSQFAIRTLVNWFAGQLIIGSLFLPWYLFAGGQLATWPSISEPLDLPTLVWRVLNVFSVGLTLDGNLATITSILLGGLFLLGCWRPTASLLLWTLVPIAAMYIVSLTRPAYNPKFLLLATPAFYILAAHGLDHISRFTFRVSRFTFHVSRSRLLSFVICSFVIGSFVISLINYYTDPRYARDDYRTILQFIDAHERAGDGILANAPGQIDVVRYYWRGNQQLFLLPRMRPPDPTATRADVDEMLGKTQRLFAIYWATDQSDPARIVETRLAERAFKARDEWHGNVRLALYGIAPSSRSAPQPLDARFGDALRLTSYQLDARRARAGDVLTLTLHWRVEQTPNTRYKIFVHLLDASGRVVAQRDGEPLADLRPTTTWRAGETIVDNYGVFIEPGTPPGDYRIEIGVYRADDGARLPVGESDHLILGTVQVQ